MIKSQKQNLFKYFRFMSESNIGFEQALESLKGNTEILLFEQVVVN